MQIKLLFELNEPLTLPLGYQYALESLIYHILSIGDKNYADFLHSEGYPGLTSNLKLFTFGQIYGKNKVKQTHITFYEDISLEIRCFHEEFCDAFMNGLSRQKIWELNHTVIELAGVEVTNHEISANMIKIHMDSPPNGAHDIL